MAPVPRATHPPISPHPASLGAKGLSHMEPWDSPAGEGARNQVTGTGSSTLGPRTKLPWKPDPLDATNAQGLAGQCCWEVFQRCGDRTGVLDAPTLAADPCVGSQGAAGSLFPGQALPKVARPVHSAVLNRPDSLGQAQPALQPGLLLLQVSVGPMGSGLAAAHTFPSSISHSTTGPVLPAACRGPA